MTWASFFFFFEISTTLIYIHRCRSYSGGLCVCLRAGLSEAHERQRHEGGALRHVRGLPGDFWLSAPEAEGRRHRVTASHQVQHHREPEQHQPHLHRLPALPLSLRRPTHFNRVYLFSSFGEKGAVRAVVI